MKNVPVMWITKPRKEKLEIVLKPKIKDIKLKVEKKL
jgi:hypothetical protein